MDVEQNIFDQFNTSDEDTSQPMMKIQHTNLWLNPSIDGYHEELQMLVLVLNNFALHQALTSSFAIPTQWMSSATSNVVYNKTTKVVIF